MSSRLSDDEPLARDWVEAWRGDTADSARMRRAYLRFLQPQTARRRVPTLQVASWVLLGVAIGMGSLYAATGPLLPLWQREPPAVTHAPPPAKVIATNPQPPLPLAAPPAASAEAEVAAPSPPANPASLASAAAAREQWQRAARGLRERDFETANRALEELASHASGAERESAQLVQAQLLLSQGREADAVSVLRTLQASARSPSVRQKSAELLARVEARPSQRSFAPPEGTNAP